MNCAKLSVILDETQALLERIGIAENRISKVEVKGKNVNMEIVTLDENRELVDIIYLTYDATSETFCWKKTGGEINVVAA